MQRLLELFRFYQAGAINAAFGFGLYALLVWLGLGMYLAQVVAHVLGVVFNYFSYSRHVFRGRSPAKLRFVLSYAVNYLVSVAVLAVVSTVVHSPYAAGLATIVIASVLNYFVLRYLVFVRKAQA